MLKKFIFIFFLFSANAFSKDIYLSEFSNPKTLGAYNLKLWGFDIYNIKLITENNFDKNSYRQKFAINIKYQRNFSKQELIDASIDEIKRIDKISPNQENLYRKYFDIIFVDVKKGDEKTAFIDKKGLKLYYNQTLQGEVANPNFALSFADIWLSENAKYEKMRNKLLAN